MSLKKAMATVAGLTMVSRVAGLVRDILTAAFLGAGVVADAFFVALKLPNFFRRVTAEGAFSVSFIPIYSETLEKEGEKEAGKFAGNVFSFMFCGLSLFTILVIAVMPYVINLIAPGFEDGSQRQLLATELSRISFPYLLMMSLTALMGGLLNAHDKFAPFAAAPILFNLCLILSLLFGKDYAQSAGHAMVYGVLVAGIVQFFWLLYSVRKAKIPLPIVKPRFSPKMKKVLKLMGPGLIGAGVMHINLFADLVIASFLEEGSISYLYYADRLNQLPLGVVGIAVGTALLPMLSRAIAANNNDDANNLFNRALEYCFVLGIPAAIALAVIPIPIITVLFERGEFTAEDSKVTATVLVGYALGLPAYIAIKVFATAFWARQDTSTPVKISVVATLMNIALSIVLSMKIGVVGIALSTGITAWVQIVIYIYYLRGVEIAIFDKRLIKNTIMIVVNACIMGGVLYITYKYGIRGLFIDGSFFMQMVAVFILVLQGIIIYALLAILSGVLNFKEFKSYIGRKK